MSEKKRSKEAIMELAFHNPVIRHCVTAYHAGLVSWEDAMMEAVIVLAGVNASQEELLTELVARSVNPQIVMTIDDFGRGLSPDHRKEIEALIQRGLAGTDTKNP